MKGEVNHIQRIKQTKQSFKESKMKQSLILSLILLAGISFESQVNAAAPKTVAAPAAGAQVNAGPITVTSQWYNSGKNTSTTVTYNAQLSGAAVTALKFDSSKRDQKTTYAGDYNSFSQPTTPSGNPTLYACKLAVGEKVYSLFQPEVIAVKGKKDAPEVVGVPAHTLVVTCTAYNPARIGAGTATFTLAEDGAVRLTFTLPTDFPGKGFDDLVKQLVKLQPGWAAKGSVVTLTKK